MATVVLVHSALGLTPHVRQWAEILERDGHDVLALDMFDGRTFDDVETAVAHIDSRGPDHWIPRAREMTSGLEGPRVYAGFSLGATLATALALTDPEAVGLIAMHDAVTPSRFGVEAWPEGLRVQLHHSEDDPWVDPDERAAFLALAGDACEEFLYPGDAHLFGFEGWHEYDDAASHEMYERVTDFLAEFDA